MKITAKKIVAAAFLGLGIVSSLIVLTNPGRAQNRVPAAAGTEPSGAVVKTGNDGLSSPGNASSKKSNALPPFVLADVSSSSPDTNLVGNLVIFTAKIGGTPPLALQWKVDKGGGFVAVPGATNSWLGLTNAQISDTGLYALFATNSAGSVGTPPHTITLIDGVD